MMHGSRRDRIGGRLRVLLSLVLFLLFAHRLPAPISETQESPTPASTVAPAAKPKPKASSKPKPKSEASEPAANPGRQQPTPKPSRFAGTWVGTMPEVPWGNVATELVVDQTETTMDWQESGKQKGHASVKLIGNTLQARFPAGITIATWSITPQSDGVTARVRLQAFMNDQTAIFQKQSGSVAPTATSQSTLIPVAKPVPDKPGFVYNPFDSNKNSLVDVRDKASGTKVKDPSGRLFVVP